MIVRESQLKEVEYLKESLRLLTNVHKALIKVHEHIASRVIEKGEETKKLLEVVTEEMKIND